MERQFLRSKKVLVAGGAGFIGSHTVTELLRLGARVSVVDRYRPEKRARIPQGARVHWLALPSPKLATIFQIEKPQYVIILSGSTNIPRTIREPLRDAQSILTTINVLEQSVAHRVERVLFASSGFIYGNTRKLPTPESAPMIPMTPYSVSKAASENYLRCFHELHGLPYAILRYATVYGPGQQSGALLYFIREISEGRRAEIYGRKTRDFVYIDDVVRANLAALSVRQLPDDPAFNIGGGRATNLRDLYAFIAKIMKHPDNKPRVLPPKPGEIDNFWLDIKKARQFLHWSPRTRLESGLRITINSFLTEKTSRK